MAQKTISKDQTATQAVSDINENFGELYESIGSATPSTAYGSSITGDSVNSKYDPSHLVTDFNTVRFIKQVKDNLFNLSGEFGHEPQMVFNDGKAYVVYQYHPTANSESQTGGDKKVRLSIVNLEDMTVVGSPVVIAKKDDGPVSFHIVNNGEEEEVSATLYEATAPNIVIIGGVARIVFEAHINKLTGEDSRRTILCYRDYDLSDGTLGNIGVLTISKNNVTEDATLELFHSLIENTGTTIQIHSQYAFVEDKYYVTIGNGSGTNGNIFTTANFIDFDWLCALSGTNLGFKFEMALYPCLDENNCCSILAAMRKDDNATDLILAIVATGRKYTSGGGFTNDGDHAAGTTRAKFNVPCRSSRPCFFSPSPDTDFINIKKPSAIYLMYQSPLQSYDYRRFTNVCATVYYNTLVESGLPLVAQGLTFIYPTILYYNGWYYMAYQGTTTGSQQHILFSRFKPFEAKWNNVITTLNKILDAYMPE